MTLTGANIIIACLKEQNVDTVFGYPGGSVLPLYDALSMQKEMKHVLVTHEQHAAHAADGYARASGKIGVAIATSGPGATNLLTGLSAAYIDSSPVVAITCNVRRAIIGTDGFQEVDIYGISMPITKHNFLVNTIEELAGNLRHAFHIARTGRPGPVLIDIPMDILEDSYAYEAAPTIKSTHKNAFSPADISTAAKLIDKSKHPLLLIGGGAKQSEGLAVALSEKLQAPIVHTLLGTGSAVCENNLGLLGMYGEEIAARALAEADLVVAIGTRFSERTMPNPTALKSHAKVVHIDIDAAEIDKNIAADVGIVGNAKDILPLLIHAVAPKTKRASSFGSKKQKTFTPAFTPEYILHILGELAGPCQIYTTEVGQHQLWAAKYLDIQNSNWFITSGGLGAMGFGLGAAIGAAFATNKRVINIAGDGSFYMNMAELSTIAHYKLPIIEIVFNNSSLGLVQQLQEDGFGKTYASDFVRSTDLLKLAEGFGIDGYRVTNIDEVESTFKIALANDLPGLIEISLPYETGKLTEMLF